MVELTLQTASTEAIFPATAQRRTSLAAAVAQTAAPADPATPPATAAATATSTTTAAVDATTAATTTATANHTPKLQHQHEHQQSETGGRHRKCCQCRRNPSQFRRPTTAVANHHPPELRRDTTVSNGATAAPQFRPDTSHAGPVSTAVVLPTAATTATAGPSTAATTSAATIATIGADWWRQWKCGHDRIHTTIPAATAIVTTTTFVLQ